MFRDGTFGRPRTCGPEAGASRGGRARHVRQGRRQVDRGLERPRGEGSGRRRRRREVRPSGRGREGELPDLARAQGEREAHGEADALNVARAPCRSPNLGRVDDVGLLLALKASVPFKSKAQRRKFAQLLVDGKITDEQYEEWNRSTGKEDLPERVR